MNLKEEPLRDEEPRTKLIKKNYSPLVIRKFTKWGWPIYVGMITDDDLSSLDKVVWEFMLQNSKEGFVENIQKVRNLVGGLNEHLVKMYNRSEGVAVVFYVDKMFISSLHGDFMTHAMCRYEFYTLLNMSTGV